MYGVYLGRPKAFIVLFMFSLREEGGGERGKGRKWLFQQAVKALRVYNTKTHCGLKNRARERFESLVVLTFAALKTYWGTFN